MRPARHHAGPIARRPFLAACALAVLSRTTSAQPPASNAIRYRLDYARTFFTSPADEVQERRILTAMVDTLSHLTSRMSTSATALATGVALADRVAVVYRRHDTYLKLRLADSTSDHVSREARSQLDAQVEPVLEAEHQALAALDARTVARFVRERPSLAPYRFAIADARRGARRVPGADRVAAAAVAPAMTGWQYELYQQLLARTPWAHVAGSTGLRDVYRDRALVEHDSSASVRAEGARLLDEGYAGQRDLYAFALIQTVRSRNALARLRGFRDAPTEVYTGRYLVPDSVRALITVLRRYADVGKAFDRFSAHAATAVVRPFPTDSGLQLLHQALGPLGPVYGAELARLLDPANGRLDLGPGDQRQATGFS